MPCYEIPRQIKRMVLQGIPVSLFSKCITRFSLTYTSVYGRLALGYNFSYLNVYRAVLFSLDWKSTFRTNRLTKNVKGQCLLLAAIASLFWYSDITTTSVTPFNASF